VLGSGDPSYGPDKGEDDTCGSLLFFHRSQPCVVLHLSNGLGCHGAHLLLYHQTVQGGLLVGTLPQGQRGGEASTPFRGDLVLQAPPGFGTNSYAPLDGVGPRCGSFTRITLLKGETTIEVGTH